MMSVLGWYGYEATHHKRLPAYSAQQHVIISDSRNNLVRHFLEQDDEWLWILDPDVVFKPETLDNLLSIADPDEAPIVAAAYWNEYDGDQRFLTWHAATEDGLRLFKALPKLEKGVLIGSCGMGCTLIHRKVLETLQEAHRDDPWTWFGHDIIETSLGPQRAGEDVTFCKRARDQGFRIVGHCGVVVEHYKPQFMPHGERM
jgi:Glycosyltransferase like family 2